MQFISAQPLIDKYRSGTFQEAEAAPYFMIYMIFATLATGFATGEADAWSTLSVFLSLVITIFGILHLKRQNQDSFGNGFLSKYFCLGWVITFRMLLITIPVAIVWFVLASIVGGRDLMLAVGILFIVAFEVIFYWWLGLLYAESNQSSSGPTTPT